MNREEKFTLWTPTANKNAFANYAAWEDKANNDRVVMFDSMDDLITCFNKNFRSFGGDGSWPNERHIGTKLTERDEWKFGKDFPTLQATNEAMSEGKMAEKYLDMVAEKRAKLLATVPRLQTLSEIAITKRKRIRYNDEDGELDIDRYMAQDENMFFDMPRQDVSSRVARIYCNLGASGSMSTEAMTENVITIAAICEIVSMAGVSVEIYMAGCAQKPISGTNWYNVAVLAKAANETLDISRLLTFALPAFFRQYVFGIWTNVKNEGATEDWGLGTVAYMAEYLPVISRFFDADIKINAANPMQEKEIQIAVNEIEKFFHMAEETTEHIELPENY